MRALDELQAETSKIQVEVKRRRQIVRDVEYLAETLSRKDAACNIVRSSVDQLTITVDLTPSKTNQQQYQHPKTDEATFRAASPMVARPPPKEDRDDVE